MVNCIILNTTRVFFFFSRVSSNTYQNTHKNNNNSILNWVYNTLQNQSTTTKISNLCSCRLGMYLIMSHTMIEQIYVFLCVFSMKDRKMDLVEQIYVFPSKLGVFFNVCLCVFSGIDLCFSMCVCNFLLNVNFPPIFFPIWMEKKMVSSSGKL